MVISPLLSVAAVTSQASSPEASPIQLWVGVGKCQHVPTELPLCGFARDARRPGAEAQRGRSRRLTERKCTPTCWLCWT